MPDSRAYRSFWSTVVSTGFRTATGSLSMLGGLALGLFSGCAKPPAVATAEGRPLFHLVLQTDWYAQAEHGGFYQALVKGYYQEAGLDVEIAQGGPGETGLTLPTGLVQFGMSRGDDAIAKISRNIPIVIVAALMQHDPQALLLHQENPVQSFKDLDGTTIMTFPGDHWIPYVQQKYHIHFSVIPMNYGMAQFMADPHFIQQCYVTNEPYYVERSGGHPKLLALADSGFDQYRVILGNTRFVNSHPEITRAFVAASIRGWNEYLSGDRSAADREIERRNPQMTPDFMAYAVAAMRRHHLVDGEPARGEATGMLSRKRLQEQIGTLQSMGALERPVTVDDVARLEFTQSP